MKITDSDDLRVLVDSCFTAVVGWKGAFFPFKNEYGPVLPLRAIDPFTQGTHHVCSATFCGLLCDVLVNMMRCFAVLLSPKYLIRRNAFYHNVDSSPKQFARTYDTDADRTANAQGVAFSTPAGFPMVPTHRHLSG